MKGFVPRNSRDVSTQFDPHLDVNLHCFPTPICVTHRSRLEGGSKSLNLFLHGSLPLCFNYAIGCKQEHA
jgi:hypothetical protein